MNVIWTELTQLNTTSHAVWEDLLIRDGVQVPTHLTKIMLRNLLVMQVASAFFEGTLQAACNTFDPSKCTFDFWKPDICCIIYVKTAKATSNEAHCHELNVHYSLSPCFPFPCSYRAARTLTQSELFPIPKICGGCLLIDHGGIHCNVELGRIWHTTLGARQVK